MAKCLALVSLFSLLLLSVCVVVIPTVSASVQVETFDVVEVAASATGFDYNDTLANFTVGLSVGGLSNVTTLTWSVVKTTFVNVGGDGFCFYVTWEHDQLMNVTGYPVSSNVPVEGTHFGSASFNSVGVVSAWCDGSIFKIYVDGELLYNSTENIYQNLVHTNVCVSGDAEVLEGDFSVVVNTSANAIGTNYLFLSIGGIMTIGVVGALLKKIKV